jgi:hypothetical protein
MLSHSASASIGFFTDVVGMSVQYSFCVPGEILEKTLGWPSTGGADVTILGSGDAGLVEVLEVPEQLRSTVPEGLAALSFLADDYSAAEAAARRHTGEVTVLDTGLPGVDLFICTMGGVPMEFMGSYQADAMPGGADG